MPLNDTLSMFSLSGRSVLVTGAGRGIGRSLALAASAAGAAVVGVARTASQLMETTDLSGGRVAALTWDVAELDRADDLVKAAEEIVGPLSGVVHAAGVQRRLPATDFSIGAWREVMSVNLEAPFFISTALHRARGAEGGPCSHVFVGSLTSTIGISGISAYAASKSGVVGVVRTLAIEWARTGSRVNCIAPGYIKTGLTADLLADTDRAAWVLGRTPMARLGTAEELSGALIYLLSEASAFMTGQVLTIDGGWLAG
jgi:NAD(P)-dependent dehydrogenase (short-subunit alcohol dehydrogenase family)